MLEYLMKKKEELLKDEPYPNYQGAKEFESEMDCWNSKIDLINEMIYEISNLKSVENVTL